MLFTVSTVSFWYVSNIYQRVTFSLSKLLRVFYHYCVIISNIIKLCIVFHTETPKGLHNYNYYLKQVKQIAYISHCCLVIAMRKNTFLYIIVWVVMSNQLSPYMLKYILPNAYFGIMIDIVFCTFFSAYLQKLKNKYLNTFFVNTKFKVA